MWFPDDEFGCGVLVQVSQVLSARYPPLDNPLKLCKAVSKRRRTWLQDQPLNRNRGALNPCPWVEKATVSRENRLAR
jgi:hypothetical protein